VRWRSASARTGTREAVVFCMATTLDRLLLGARPYWGEEDEAIHFTHIRSGARRLPFALLPLFRGRGGRLLTADRGYSSRNARRLELHFDGPFVLDGELYSARSAGGPLVLTTRTTRWIAPE